MRSHQSDQSKTADMRPDLSLDTRQPSIGRIVHFVMPCGAHRPAVVLQPFSNDQIILQVFTTDDEPRISASALKAHDEATKLPNTWHWPELPELS